MRATLAILALGAVPAFAAPGAPWSGGKNTTTSTYLTVTGTSASSASSVTVSPSPTYSMPACWEACFGKYGVSSESELCTPPISSEVSSCIQQTCDAGAAAQYSGWLSQYCGGETIVTVTSSEYTTICPVTETQVSGEQTYTSVYTTTSTLTSSWETTITPTPSSPGGYISPTASTCTDSDTIVYTTHYVTETVTETGASPTPTSVLTWTYGGVWTSTQTFTETETLESTITYPGGGASTTEIVTTFTTVCPVTETWTSGAETTTVTSTTVSTGYSTWISTWTTPVAPYPTSSGSSSACLYTTGTGTGTATGTVGCKPSPTCTAKPTSTGKCVPCQGQPDSNPDNFCGLTVDTDIYDAVPKTCRTVEYTFHITNQTIAPDGIPRMGLVINGQMPGPLIEANWGDTVIVHVYNDMPPTGHNGTSIHFHGIRQNYTNAMDGVPSIVQCPLAPGSSQTYTWVATSYGSSWYHSHFAIQTYEGVFGPMLIHGPVQAGAEYDYETPIVLQDWSHATADSLLDSAQLVSESNRSNPVLDTGLINGLNIWGEDGAPGTTGQRWQLNVTSGKRYRLRIVNAAIAATFVFYVDGHPLTVIAADFTPIVPFVTTTLSINIGQRYDVILTADQAVDNYWMRSDNQQPCSPVIAADNIKAIIHYEGAPDAVPTSQPFGYAPTCADMPTSSLVPIVPMVAGSQSQSIDETVLISANGGTPNLYKWTLSGTTFQSDWSDPTLLSILDNGTIPTVSGSLAIEAPNLGEWVYVIIDSPIPLPHPIHLHGHDFLVLAQGNGQYTSSVPLNLNNPPRRDVANMNGDPLTGEGSYLVIAFLTNNPGAWLMHCHIGWHVTMGFALQIIEAESQIPDTTYDTCAMQDTCAAWDAFAAQYQVTDMESGV